MADPSDAVFLEFAATAEPASVDYQPSRTRIAVVPNLEPIFVEFTATAEPAEPGTFSTRSQWTVRGKHIVPLELFAGLHPDCRAMILSRLKSFADHPDQLFDFDPPASQGGRV